MPLMRTTWITQIARHSFSESWFRQASSADPTEELIVAKEYAVARAAIMGAGCNIYGIRISNDDDRRQKAYLAYTNYPGNEETDGDGHFIHPAAASNVALNMLFNNLGQTQEKLIQLRGMWDEAESGGGNVVLSPAYVGLIQAFGAKVVQKAYGWKYTTTTPKSAINTWVSFANGTVGFTLAAGLFTVDQVNAQAHVPVSINSCNASPNLNGPLTVVVISATECVTLKPIAARTPIVGFNGFMTRRTTTFTAATGGRVQRLGKRQAGAPLLQSVGRGRVRRRG